MVLSAINPKLQLKTMLLLILTIFTQQSSVSISAYISLILLSSGQFGQEILHGTLNTSANIQ